MNFDGGVLSFPPVPSLLAACLVLLVGGWLTDRVSWLARYSIPGPIVGGVLFAVAAGLIDRFADTRIVLRSEVRSLLLLVFFAAIGLSADLGLLRSGGSRLVRFLVVLFPFLVAQNALGVGLATALGLHPVMGLVAGSVTLVGGHGTGAAYAERFAADHGIPGVMELTMTAATLGLVIGGIVGGPVARRLIRGLKRPAPSVSDDLGVVGGPVASPVTTLGFIGALAAGLVAVLAGQQLGIATSGSAITVPSFLWCLIVGLVIRNAGAPFGLRLNDAAIDLIGSVCLSLFLAWTMMALDLRAALVMAGPLLLILAAQTVLVALWAGLVCFRVLGRDYEAAVMSGALCGFAMGATATAIANMQAVTRDHGPAPQAFLVVPIVGAFFIDIMNAAVLTAFLALPLLAS